MSKDIKERFLQLIKKNGIEQPKQTPVKKKESDLWRWDTLEDVSFD